MKKVIIFLSFILLSLQVNSQEFELPENYSLSEALVFLESQGMIPADFYFKRMDIFSAINEEFILLIYKKELTEPFGKYNYSKGLDRCDSATWKQPFFVTNIIVFKYGGDKNFYLILQGTAEGVFPVPRDLVLDFKIFYEGEPNNIYKIPKTGINKDPDSFLFYLNGEKEVKDFLKFFSSSKKIMVSYTVEGKKYTVPFNEEDRGYAIQAANAYLALIKDTQKKR